jgi:flavin reductase (DIM6/NTAB) family NADH-FMN oxidoreductase RutF
MSMGERRNLDSLRALASALAPRPVVLVTTLSADGVLNVAPFSMVMPLSAEPPLLALGISPRGDGGAGHAPQPAGCRRVRSEHGEPGAARVRRGRLSRRRSPGRALPDDASETVRPPRLVGAVARLECRLVEVFRPRGKGPDW